MKTRKRNLQEVYVWQIPVRFFHWINALCIVILCITGYIIGNPPAIESGGEAIYSYWMGWIRMIHLATAMVFVINGLVRVYWAFAGNRFAKWNNFVPITKAQWKSILQTTKVDILLLSKNAVYDIGHNSLAATTYFGLFILFILQSLTGFMMMFVTTNNVFEPITTWGLIELNGFFVVRYIHHILMWLFILFAIIHIYLVFYHDYIERNGIASSMIGGWKFIRSDLVEELETEIKQEKEIDSEKSEIKTDEKKSNFGHRKPDSR